MWDIVGLGIVTLYASLYVVAAIAWLAGVALIFRTMANRRPGVRLWNADLGYIPLTLMFRPDLLTESGQRCRLQFGRVIRVFLGALLAGLSLATLMRFLP